MAAIIFTESLVRSAQTSRHTGSLLHKWARADGPSAEAFRHQLERAAACVPSGKRKQVLGHLHGKSSSDDQVRANAGYILLAKALQDLGWFVEFEPEEAGKTPDLKIHKSAASFIVEVRRVAEREVNPSPKDVDRIKEALDGIRTRTPISLRAIHCPGGASLKRFRAHMERVLGEGLQPGPGQFHEGNVYVGFDVYGAFEEPMTAVFGMRSAPIYGELHETVRRHISEKLSKYKVPLVIALDFFDIHDAFVTVEEVLLGREVMRIPIDVSGTGATHAPCAGRDNDGLLVHVGDEGRRARSRLQAVLAFGFQSRESGWSLRSRVFANPAASQAMRLIEFAPIPRLVAVRQTETGVLMDYLDEFDRPLDTEALNAWAYVP